MVDYKQKFKIAVTVVRNSWAWQNDDLSIDDLVPDSLENRVSCAEGVLATTRQTLGAFGEDRVVRECSCPRCKRPPKTLVRLPTNFKCADVICDFCGYLGQVKAATSSDIDRPPRMVMGAAWGPQKERMDAGIYFPLFLVLATKGLTSHAIYYLAADLQQPSMILQRKPLSANARRAGWTGYLYDLDQVRSALVRLR